MPLLVRPRNFQDRKRLEQVQSHKCKREKGHALDRMMYGFPFPRALLFLRIPFFFRVWSAGRTLSTPTKGKRGGPAKKSGGEKETKGERGEGARDSLSAILRLSRLAGVSRATRATAVNEIRLRNAR